MSFVNKTPVANSDLTVALADLTVALFESNAALVEGILGQCLLCINLMHSLDESDNKAVANSIRDLLASEMPQLIKLLNENIQELHSLLLAQVTPITIQPEAMAAPRPSHPLADFDFDAMAPGSPILPTAPPPSPAS